jgi:hypothetical protein
VWRQTRRPAKTHALGLRAGAIFTSASDDQLALELPETGGSASPSFRKAMAKNAGLHEHDRQTRRHRDYDARHGYIASAPELRQPIVALSLGGLRRRVEALLLPDDVVLQLDGLAERERHRRRAQAQLPTR